jgi:hypothetical protein
LFLGRRRRLEITLKRNHLHLSFPERRRLKSFPEASAARIVFFSVLLPPVSPYNPWPSEEIHSWPIFLHPSAGRRTYTALFKVHFEVLRSLCLGNEPSSNIALGMAFAMLQKPSALRFSTSSRSPC